MPTKLDVGFDGGSKVGKKLALQHSEFGDLRSSRIGSPLINGCRPWCNPQHAVPHTRSGRSSFVIFFERIEWISGLAVQTVFRTADVSVNEPELLPFVAGVSSLRGTLLFGTSLRRRMYTQATTS